MTYSLWNLEDDLRTLGRYRRRIGEEFRPEWRAPMNGAKHMPLIETTGLFEEGEPLTVIASCSCGGYRVERTWRLEDRPTDEEVMAMAIQDMHGFEMHKLAVSTG